MLKCNITDVEAILTEKYNSVIRWAVVDIVDNVLKISFTYEKEQ